MKKLLFVAYLGVAGLVIAKEKSSELPKESNVSQVKKKVEQEKALKRLCVFVHSDCGEAGLACGEANSDGELHHEVIDEMRQNCYEIFCGFDD